MGRLIDRLMDRLIDRPWRWGERLRRLFFKSRVEREVLDEMQYHLEMEAREHEGRGLDSQAARRAARLDFGNVERFREEARETRFGHSLDVVLGDAGYSLRLLRRHPGFAAAAIAALAVGIGSVTAVSSLVSSALLHPLPYSDAERVVWIQNSWHDQPAATISPAEYLDYREHLDEVFSSLGVYSFGARNLSLEDRALRLRTAFLSDGVFPALGVEPLLGRTFSRSEEEQGEAVVVLGESAWRRLFGAREDILGRSVVLNRVPLQVIGVMPSRFRLPEEMWLDGGSELYLPQGISPGAVASRGSHYLSGVARLAPGISRARAARATEALAATFSEDYPQTYPAGMSFAATAVSLSRQLRGPLRAPMIAVFVAVGVLLLIACTNVASLILARTDLRSREMALRSSLGAARRRLVQQVVTESLVIGLIGGLCGLGVAALALAAGRRLFPAGFDWPTMLRLDVPVALFGIALSVLTGIVFGLVPALAVGRRRFAGASSSSSSFSSLALRSAGLAAGARWRSLLVAAELALTLVLLVAAGLLLKSFSRLVRVDPGYRTTEIASARLSLPRSDYPESSDLVSFYETVTKRLAARPEVDAADAVTNLPLSTRLGDMDFRIEGRPIPEGARSPAADWQAVTPGYFETMGLTLLEGRALRATDRADSPGAVVINRSFADTHWPGESALGARFTLGGDFTQPRVAEVVGVVADVRHENLTAGPRPQMYFAHAQFRFWANGRAPSSLELVVRSRLDAPVLESLLADTVRELDPHLPISDFRTMEQVRARSVSIPRLLMGLLAAFAAIAMLLAAIGVYGVTAQVVGRRLPEYGLRLALGARRADITWSVLRGAGVLVTFGLVAGLLGSAAATRLLSSLLFEVDPLDLGVVLGVGALLVAFALLAGFLAARRAARVDPIALLRAE